MKENLQTTTKTTVIPKFRPFFSSGKEAQSIFFQPRLKVGPVDDVYEREADAVADKVMRMPDQGNLQTSISPVDIQRKCTHCEEEEKVQRKENTQHTGQQEVPHVLNQALQSGGNTLDTSTRSFMESRFGHDFSGVQVHTDSIAAKSAQSINALAYTSGNHIVFNEGQYSPGSEGGKRLLAHELTHVVQQRSSTVSPKIQRAVAANSVCAPNSHGSPADPLAVIRTANERAVNMALGASGVLFIESVFILSPGNTFNSSFNAYRGRFGDPVAVGTRYRNRFDSTLHPTLRAAQSSEMRFLSTRMKNISTFLERNIRFRCTGTSHTTIGNCTHHCSPGDVLASCAAGHGNTIAICADFWGVSADQQAIGMIHEVFHMLHHFGDHAMAQTSAQRRTEPECYTSMVADIYGVAPFDPSCPVI